MNSLPASAKKENAHIHNTMFTHILKHLYTTGASKGMSYVHDMGYNDINTDVSSTDVKVVQFKTERFHRQTGSWCHDKMSPWHLDFGQFPFIWKRTIVKAFQMQWKRSPLDHWDITSFRLLFLSPRPKNDSREFETNVP